MVTKRLYLPKPKERRQLKSARCRLRDLGVKIGSCPTGRYNAITDVPGVLVGHTTRIEGSGKLVVGKGPIRTGVTAILPNSNIFNDRVIGSCFILNGAGEVSGLMQVMEWGLIETPILLTNSLSVGTCSEAVVKYMLKKHPGIGIEQDVILPIVGECDDSWLNDIGGHHIRDIHVFKAIKNAANGPIAEGNVGGGTGMITCDFKAGIGTSSRRLHQREGGYTVGVIVMSNFGTMSELRLNGIPLGNILKGQFENYKHRVNNYGSIIMVIGTDAPLSSHQIQRLCKRAALGIGRVGSYASHTSGEIILGFSTANTVPRKTKKMIYRMKVLLDQAIDPLYIAVMEATEEAILNSLCMAETMEGHSKNIAHAIPLDSVRTIVKAYGKQKDLLTNEPHSN